MLYLSSFNITSACKEGNLLIITVTLPSSQLGHRVCLRMSGTGTTSSRDEFRIGACLHVWQEHEINMFGVRFMVFQPWKKFHCSKYQAKVNKSQQCTQTRPTHKYSACTFSIEIFETTCPYTSKAPWLSHTSTLSLKWRPRQPQLFKSSLFRQESQHIYSRHQIQALLWITPGSSLKSSLQFWP